MLVMETIGKIRRLVLRGGRGIRSVSRDTGHSQGCTTLTIKHETFGDILEKEIGRRYKNKERAKKTARVLRISVLSFTAAATIALGWNFSETQNAISNKSWATNLALVFTTLATLSSSFNGLWKSDEYWLKQRAILERLHKIRRDYQYLGNDKLNIPEADIDSLFSEYQRVISSGVDYWESMAANPSERDEPQ